VRRRTGRSSEPSTQAQRGGPSADLSKAWGLLIALPEHRTARRPRQGTVVKELAVPVWAHVTLPLFLMAALSLVRGMHVVKPAH
jgi:hypothetical protein